MPYFVSLIATTNANLATVNKISRQSLGQPATTNIDRSHRDVPEEESFLVALSGMLRGEMSTTVVPEVLKHVTLTFAVVVPSRLSSQLVTCCRSASCIILGTNFQDVDLLILTDTLDQWRESVILGCTQNTDPTVRQCFNAIYRKIRDSILPSLWEGYTVEPGESETFLLEKIN